MQTLDVILPIFNRDAEIVDYVVQDFLKQDIDMVVLANTGVARLGMSSDRVKEVWQPLPRFYPGITRNMGAAVSSAQVQIHSGADILTGNGNIGLFRDVQDGELVSARNCFILKLAATQQALSGQRIFPKEHCHKNNTGAAQALTKRTALFTFKGPFDWEMRKWGWVDVDLHQRIAQLGVTHRFLPINMLHLYHDGGCCDLTFGKAYADADYTRNNQLMHTKHGRRGWWT